LQQQLVGIDGDGVAFLDEGDQIYFADTQVSI
jgi:hypothetical protein